MNLLIYCHFLFEVNLLCLSLHIEVLSFEDSELSRGRYKTECQLEKLEHFRHILLLIGFNHSFLFLMLAKRYHFSSPVTIQGRNGRCCSRTNRWRTKRDVHMATRWFSWFYPLNANVSRWWNGHSSSRFLVLAYTDVDNCRLMCLNDLYQNSKVFLNGECH